MSDGPNVGVQFSKAPDGGREGNVDAESENAPEVQRRGWQSILDNFARHGEAKRTRSLRPNA